ncbi:hypothetical protein PsorP6_004338 [Peronosclerospora sorghi]|uniref:Uncharacterized protein n=1 Tax=Peronosclerospora sorghi TaxID=230839 RepID=A0ACC0VRR6_9STRA|nr:hypothetical protein PsorP6_004338 [Peronosclerospora sorghi]
MWTTEADDDPRELQRRRQAYARELDHQIALRRKLQIQEKMDREELERKLAPSECSPSKWLVEGGQLDKPTTSRSTKTFSESINFNEEQRQDRGAATGERNSVSSSHPRFRVTDESESSQRQRERAKQMQWKRILDEQVQEKARLRRQEEDKKRRSDEDAAREELRYLHEQQQQAQRRLGRYSPAMNKDDFHPRPTQEMDNHRQRDDPQSSKNNLHNFALNNDQRENNKPKNFHTDWENESPSKRQSFLHPPSPLYMQMPLRNERYCDNDNSRETSGDNREINNATRQLYSQDNNVEASYQQTEHQHRAIDEYRLLLVEIRREREELRRERDEIRREKEELRIQRALLQLENEKLATLVDAERALNERQQEDLHGQLQDQYEVHQQQYEAQAYQHRASPAQFVDPEADNARKVNNETFSRLTHIRQTLGDLSVHDREPRRVVRRKPSSPMSMAYFSAPTSSKYMAQTIVDSPRYQRLLRYRRNPAVPAHEDSILNQSLVGESVFVPLSPKSLSKNNNEPLSRTPSSPTSSNSNRRLSHPLRSSRVIQSRGFYDFKQDIKSDDKAESLASGLIKESDLGSDVGSSCYGDENAYSSNHEDDELDN